MAVTMDQVRDVLAPDEPAYGAARLLGQDAVHHLIELMRGPDEHFAVKAASLLGMIGGSAAAETLRRAASDPRLTVRIAVAATAHNLGPELAGELQLELLQSPEPVIRKVALESMPSTRSDHVSDAIQRIAGQDEVPELRVLAEQVRNR